MLTGVLFIVEWNFKIPLSTRKIYNKYFTLRKLKLNYHNRKPWFTQGLKNYIKSKKQIIQELRENQLCGKWNKI